ncbi:glycogen debranching protein GlgX [Herbaspirillum sp. SJZ107]|uniref:glycogen debranching protein GlgX n=1 Tax=Herbaspirillum sp. SJZ107 TaxID=2572881 RepID=UPI001154D910|nr:glycogen debranching protein GlgX [Herbaspirillum sp. SJZ107]TQK03543.1 glycogen operon protein [Herbaspirillum sp. SJZ107]
MTVADALHAGRPYPLGAHTDGDGVNFALVAPHAASVELCLFDPEGKQELARLRMPACEDGVWHGYLEGAATGQVYGYRVAGPYAPQQGQRFNPNKVLLDPYARAVVGEYLAQPGFDGHAAGAADQPDPADNAAIALKAQVIDDAYDWGGDQPPRVPAADTILYEVHVKGYTRLHPDVPEALRGTYAGLAQPAVLDTLQRLGVTTLSLLPAHARADEMRLQKMGLSNYWGYSSIGFFAPERRYWSGQPGSTPISEFRDMVKAVHGRGIEVVLDVVYNHTAETDEFGPTLSFRGIDNQLYYHLRKDNPALYENWTGCGNCLNLAEPRVLQLVMDSLRYWVEAMHVDGFRFDLAPVLARSADGFSGAATFLAALRQDPVLARVKLIAEPWDIGPGGYRLGQFPPGWFEWNDKYRDTMRAFWLQSHEPAGALGEFARRFAGSSDVFHHDGRQPTASVNFITAHDGFTLRDLVSYNDKHNEANGEQNRDGHAHNLSWNCGVEGATDDRAVLQLRARLQRALLATLFFSQGTPMLLAGDDIGHSQQGNNNAYCQDNAVCWLDWRRADDALAGFVGALTGLRRRYRALRRADWYTGAVGADGHADIAWLKPDGAVMDDAAWNGGSHCIGIRMCAPADGQDADETCLLLVNAQAQPADFTLPPGTWRALTNSAFPELPPHDADGTVEVPAHAVLLLALPWN